jgi:hypothetical protein
VNRARLGAWGALLGAFVLGGVAGGGAVYAARERRYADLVRQGPPPLGPGGRRSEAWARRLDLDAAQREQLDAIFECRRGERERLERQIFEGCGKELVKHREQIDAEIRAMLRPDQQRRFDQMLRERKLGPPPFGRPPPGGPSPNGGGRPPPLGDTPPPPSGDAPPPP